MLRIQMQYSQFKPLPALENSVNLVLYTCSSLQNEGFDCDKVTFIMKFSLAYYFNLVCFPFFQISAAELAFHPLHHCLI